ncbi:hypothetical protein JXA80_10265, partial [bacterium]|nr:hypothetical protein [candidate division CSSED10-310 bacterium]
MTENTTIPFTRKHFFLLLTITQMVLDWVTVVVSFLLGYEIYHLLLTYADFGAGVQPFKLYRNLSLTAGFLFLIIFERFGLYSRKVGVLNIQEMKRILQSLFIGSLILISASFLLRPIDPMIAKPILSDTDAMLMQGPLLYSRLILLYSLVILFVLINLQRHCLNRVLLKMHTRGPGLNRVLIYGAGVVGQQLQRR